MDAASTSSGASQANNTMTGNTRLTAAPAPGTPLTGMHVGKAAVPQETTPTRISSPEEVTKEDHDKDEDDEVAKQEADSEPFTPTQCLFCNTTSPDFESTLSHMSKSHSLFIPASIDNGSLTLAVDLETLVRYMHLVISTYHECLLCHTQRQSAHAVRQHMTGKGHCRIDLEDGESEFRDFFESVRRVGGEHSGDEGTSGSEDEVEAAPAVGEQHPLRLREGSLLLASGKLLSHRSAPAPRNHRPLSEAQKPTRRAGALLASASLTSSSPTPATQQPSSDAEGSPPPPSDPAPETTNPTAQDTGRAMTRLERRAEGSGRSTLAVAMSQMSLGDRAALAHLPAAEQRAVVLRQFKQQDRARHEARRYWSKVELRGNKIAKK